MTGSSLLDQAMTVRKVRRLKLILLAVIAVGMVVLILVSLSHKGMTASPLFLPVPAILMTVLMAAMLMNFVSIIFNAVEISTSDTPSRRFLASKHGFKVSVWTGGLCIILVIMFAFAIPYVESEVSTHEIDTIDTGTGKEHEWFTIDDFDLTYAYEWSLEVSDGAPIDYTISALNTTSGRYEEKERGQVQEGNTKTIDLEPWPKSDYRTEIFTDGTPTDDTSDFDYQVKRRLNPELAIALTGFLGVIAVSSLIWAAVAYVLMKRYEVESVGGLAGTFPDDEY